MLKLNNKNSLKGKIIFTFNKISGIVVASKKYFTLVIFFSLLINTLNATVYYVSNSGNDSSSGTSINSPWRTLAKINSLTPNPGDQILLRRGDTWNGSITIKSSGNSANPIVYGAYGTGTNPTISGFTTITGWTNEGGGIYSKVINPVSAPNMLIINGIQQKIGRYPNNTNLIFESSNTNVSITDNQLTGTPNWTGAEAVIYKNPLNTLDRCLITNHSSNTLTYTSLGTTRNTSTSGDYFIQNDIRTLDLYGEWYYNKSTKKLSVFFGTVNPSGVTTQVAIYDNLISNSSMDYISINNLNFEGSNNSTISFRSGTDNCEFKNCSIKFSGYDAFTLSGNSILVDNCSVSIVNGGGIVVNGVNAIVTNNSVTDVGMIPGQTNMIVSTCGMTINGNNPEIKYNSLENIAYMGIYFTVSAVKGVIQYNKLNKTSQLRIDSGSIYLGHDHTGTLIDHNIVLNAGGSGIFLDEDCTGVIVTNNTVSGAFDNGIKIHISYSNTVQSNTLFNNTIGVYFANWFTTKRVYDNDFMNNIIFANTGQFASRIVNRYTGDNNFGTASNNYYAHSSSESLVYQINVVVDKSNKNFSQWKGIVETDYTSFDVAKNLNSENVSFLFNDTSDPKSFVLSYPMVDVKNIKYSNSVTLNAYSSIILFKDPNPSPTDLTAPVVSVFTIPSSYISLTVPVTSFTASDNKAVTGYLITESATAPQPTNAGWTATAPGSYTFSSEGTKTLYAWAKDAAGNVSSSVSDQVVISFPRLGNTDVYNLSNSSLVRRAMPVTFSEAGIIQSITIYHNGGSGNMLLGVYANNSDSPGSLLGVTSSTVVNISEGWQKVNLSTPVSVNSGQTVWLAWVFQNSIGVRYTSGTPGRAQSDETWGAGMPSVFGTSTIGSNKFSIYCNYIQNIELPDVTKPIITDFSIPSTSNSLTVNISSFTASDNKAVTGYIVTESSTAPIANNTGWSSTAPVSFTFSSEGTKTLYAWAKDAAGNVSVSLSDQVTINLPDITKPVLTTFSIPATSNSLTINITSFTASDNKAVTGYLITESATAPQPTNAGWTATAPGSYTFSSEGTKTLYAWAKDAAGNVSSSVSDQIIISLPDVTKPVITSFSIPNISNTLTINIGSFTATDNKGVSGYIVTESGTVPLANNTEWTTSAPETYTFSSEGTKTLYAWAKDDANNISESFIAEIVISIPKNDIYILGNTDVYNLVNSANYRRAMPFTANENGIIQSISIYHNGGTGEMLLGVYSDESGLPGTLISSTPSTLVNNNEGWQTVLLSNPVSIVSGQTIWLAWIFQNSVAVRFTSGSPSRAQSGSSWLDGMPVNFGVSTLGTTKFSIYCNYVKEIVPPVVLKDLGNTEVYNQENVVANRRAMPFTFNENGEIQSISIYHNGGTGNLLLGVYTDNSGSPGSLLGTTPTTIVNTAEGWQTVSLTRPVFVNSGETIWLAWVFQNSVRVRFTSGTPGRAQSGETYTSGMPTSFGLSTLGTNKFSIYCTYTEALPPLINKDLGNIEVFNQVNESLYRRAMPFTFSEDGNIQSISIYHNGGIGELMLGVYSNIAGLPGTLLGITPSTLVNNAEGWQTVLLSSPVSVNSGQTIWLAWVFQNNVGVRYTSGSPARAQSGATWLAGMPATFGTSSIGTNKFSIFCTYTAIQNNLKEANYSKLNDDLSYQTTSNNVDDQVSKYNIQIEGLNDFKLYPNPANSHINIEYSELPNSKVVIEITDGQGRVMFIKNSVSESNVINISNFPTGLYFVRSSSGFDTIVKKLIVK